MRFGRLAAVVRSGDKNVQLVEQQAGWIACHELVDEINAKKWFTFPSSFMCCRVRAARAAGGCHSSMSKYPPRFVRRTCYTTTMDDILRWRGSCTTIYFFFFSKALLHQGDIAVFPAVTTTIHFFWGLQSAAASFFLYYCRHTFVAARRWHSEPVTSRRVVDTRERYQKQISKF